MTGMDLFNTIAGGASIIGLGFSFWINKRTEKIQKSIEFAHIAENFNLNRDSIMDRLRSYGLNAIREDFKDENLLSDFQYELLSYAKEFDNVLTTEERTHISQLLELIKCKPLDKEKYRTLLNEVTSKPKLRGNPNG